MAEAASEAYFNRIDDARVARHFAARMEVYFDGDAAAPVNLGGSMIQNYTLRNEMAAEDTFPLGRVSSNMLTINLNNTSRCFTATNTDSPYNGKIAQGTKCKLYTSLLLADGSYEEFLMGTVYTSDWDTASNSVIANLVCYDRLYFLRQKQAPKLPVIQGTTIANLFMYLFKGLGLTDSEFIIDSTLEYAVPYGWLPGKTVYDVLQSLTQAGMCTVYVNRRDQIVVTVPYKRIVAGRILSASISENAQIKTVSQSQAAYKAYTGVDVTYCSYKPQEDTLLVSLTGQSLEANMNEFLDISLATEPALKVDRVMLQNTSLDIAALSVGATSMSMYINATSEVTNVDIDVYGVALEKTEQTIKFSAPDEATRSQKKHLEVTSELMQSKDAAKQYGNFLNQIVTDPEAYLSATLRGDLTFDIGDVYVFNDPQHSINLIPVYFTRITFNYSGALSCEVDCTNYDSLAIYDFAFIAPGMVVKKLREI